MKWVRQHLIMILINAVFALFVGVNVCGYANYCESRKVQESCENLQQAETSPGALIESQGSIQNLLSRAFSRGGLKRAGERNLLSGLGNRALLHMMGPWSSLLHGSSPVAFVNRGHGVASFADRFTTSKEFFIYTLERMLC